jgi:hypothetical protein
MTHCAGLLCWPTVPASPKPPTGLVFRGLPLQLISGPCCKRFQLVPKAAGVCGMLIASWPQQPQLNAPPDLKPGPCTQARCRKRNVVQRA